MHLRARKLPATVNLQRLATRVAEVIQTDALNVSVQCYMTASYKRNGVRVTPRELHSLHAAAAGPAERHPTVLDTLYANIITCMDKKLSYRRGTARRATTADILYEKVAFEKARNR